MADETTTTPTPEELRARLAALYGRMAEAQTDEEYLLLFQQAEALERQLKHLLGGVDSGSDGSLTEWQQHQVGMDAWQRGITENELDLRRSIESWDRHQDNVRNARADAQAQLDSIMVSDHAGQEARREREAAKSYGGHANVSVQPGGYVPDDYNTYLQQALERYDATNPPDQPSAGVGGGGPEGEGTTPSVPTPSGITTPPQLSEDPFGIPQSDSPGANAFIQDALGASGSPALHGTNPNIATRSTRDHRAMGVPYFPGNPGANAFARDALGYENPAMQGGPPNVPTSFYSTDPTRLAGVSREGNPLNEEEWFYRFGDWADAAQQRRFDPSEPTARYMGDFDTGWAQYQAANPYDGPPGAGQRIHRRQQNQLGNNLRELNAIDFWPSPAPQYETNPRTSGPPRAGTGHTPASYANYPQSAQPGGYSGGGGGSLYDNPILDWLLR